MANTTPANIHIGRGEVWIGVNVPATGNVVPLTAGDPASGSYIGATMVPATFVHRPSTFDVQIEQDPAIVVSVLTTEELRAEFEISELTYTNLSKILANLTTQTDPTSGNFPSIGGKFTLTNSSILIISPKRDGTYVEAMLYNAFFPEDRSFAFSRSGQTSIRIVARALSVTTRARGDRLGFIHGNVTSA